MENAIHYELKVQTASEASHAFWRGKTFQNKVVVLYGKIGKQGQRDERKFDSEEQAENYLVTKIYEKLKEGYRLKTVEEPTSLIDQDEVSNFDYKKSIDRILAIDDIPCRKALKLYKLGYLAAKTGDIASAERAFEFLIITPSHWFYSRQGPWKGKDLKFLGWKREPRFTPRLLFCPNDSLLWIKESGEKRIIKVINVSAEQCRNFDENLDIEVDGKGNLTKLGFNDEKAYGAFFESIYPSAWKSGVVFRFPYLESFSLHFRLDDDVSQSTIVAPKLRKLELGIHTSFIASDFSSYFFTPLVSSFYIGREGSMHHRFRFDILKSFPALRELDFHIWEFKYNDSLFSILPILKNLEKFRLSYSQSQGAVPYFFADYVLKYVDWLDEMEPFRELVEWVGDYAYHRIGLHNRITDVFNREPYNRERGYDWGTNLGLYQYYYLMIPEQLWLLNKAILDGLDLSLFMGYTGDLNGILEALPAKFQPIEVPFFDSPYFNRDYFNRINTQKINREEPELQIREFKSIQKHFRSRLLDRSLNQVQKGGSTIFFDLDALTKKGSEAVLAKYIVDARSAEISNTVLHRNSKTIDLSPLWCTHYGFSLLRTLNLGITCNQSEFSVLTEHLSDLDLKVKLTEDPSKVRYGCLIPETHRRLILSRLTATLHETVEQRLARLADFEEFPMNPWISLERGFSIDGFSEEHPRSEEWLRRRDLAADCVQITYEDEESVFATELSRGSFE